MLFNITTKDRQWTMARNMTEKEAIEFWNNNYSDTTAILDYVIVGDNGVPYECANDGHGYYLEPECYPV